MKSYQEIEGVSEKSGKVFFFFFVFVLFVMNNNLDWSKVARALFFEYLELILWRDSFDYLLWIFALGIVVLLQRSISLSTFLRHPLSIQLKLTENVKHRRS